MIRNSLALLALLLTAAAAGHAASVTTADEAALRALSDRYVGAWLNNDRDGVMGVMAPEAVFIPHDGVKPKIGFDAIDAFWFPNGRALGSVRNYSQTITAIDVVGDYATLYGRFDLTWQNEQTRYRWVGNFLINASKRDGRWLVTHMMASDEDPVVTKIDS